MPYLLVIIGTILLVTGAKNTYLQFGAQLRSDLTGPNNFLMYAAALGIVGAAGYVEPLRKFSHYFMALILISLVLANRGFFAKFSEAWNAGPEAIPVSPASDAGGKISALPASIGPATMIVNPFGFLGNITGNKIFDMLKPK